MLHKHLMVVLIILLAAILGMGVLGFLLYHLHMIGSGMTTNETYKWEWIEKIHHKLILSHERYLERIEQGIEETVDDEVDLIDSNSQINEIQLKTDLNQMKNDNENVGCIPVNVSIETKTINHSKNIDNSKNINKNHENYKQDITNDNEPVIAVSEKIKIPEGQHRSRYLIRKVIDDEAMPETLSVHPGPMPNNIYDLGFFKNIW